jgi:FtsP/CotA-like multicopper oxidase with cupredoxin domain
MNHVHLRKASLIQILSILAVLFLTASGTPAVPLPGGSLDPGTIPKYSDPMPIPQTMPKTDTLEGYIDFYRIAARQFQQQVLPASMNLLTTVWGYGSAGDPATFSYPARTIEAKVNAPVRVQWINDLKEPGTGAHLPHLLPIDQTLHWANPSKDCRDGSPGPDCRGQSQSPYAGPVPIVTHLHGAHVAAHSDGYPEAWYLPDASDIPAGYALKGSHYTQIPGAGEAAGQATYEYSNDQRAATLWYHDHTLGMTRANVYAGLAGVYLIRDSATDPAGLPGGAYEIPLLIQDKSFNSDGSLFYPSNRAFFEGLDPAGLQIPFIPDPAFNGTSDVSPIWNPEFFGNTMVVNGKTWPYLNVERRRYRLRILNGSDTRVLLLKFDSGLPFWQIGADGGFLPNPIKLNELLIGPAERVDVIVNFAKAPLGAALTLLNIGPDEPFGGGVSGVDFAPADPDTTGQVMQFRVVKRTSTDTSTPPYQLSLPGFERLGAAAGIRPLSLNEEESATVPVVVAGDGSIVYDPFDPGALPFAPVEALLGTAKWQNGVVTPTPLEWMDMVTETPALGQIEQWSIFNFTEDAHPIHIHQVQFEVLNRQDIEIGPDGTATLVPGTVQKPKLGERGTKDTLLMYPGQVTRVKVKFDLPGLYAWHCHILSHEDNEMMRPICVGGICP